MWWTSKVPETQWQVSFWWFNLPWWAGFLQATGHLANGSSSAKSHTRHSKDMVKSRSIPPNYRHSKQVQKELCYLMDSGLEQSIFFPRHQWSNLNYFHWQRYDVDFLRSKEETSSTFLENLAVMISWLTVSIPSVSLCDSNPMKLSHVGLHQQIPWLWELEKNFHQKREDQQTALTGAKEEQLDYGEVQREQYSR